MLELRTPRLKLIAATLETALAETRDRLELSALLGASIPPGWPPPLNDEKSAQFFVDVLRKHPERSGWMMWYFVLDRPGGRTAIGNGGFKGPPVDGAVEVGYSIMEEVQGRGYATEAVSALLEWAYAHGAERVVAQTFPELHASQKVLQKLGFHLTKGAHTPGALRYEKLRPHRADQT